MNKIVELNHSTKGFFKERNFTDKVFWNIDSFINDEHAICYYAKNGNEVLGYVYGYVHTRMDSVPNLYIHSIDVNEEFRKLGIATDLMETVLSYAKLHNMRKVFLITNKSNQKAVGLYKKTKGLTPYEDDLVFEWVVREL